MMHAYSPVPTNDMTR